MKQTSNRPLLSRLLAVAVASAVFAWRDLSRRSDDQVRGKKGLWRAVIAINPGNSLINWAISRR